MSACHFTSPPSRSSTNERSPPSSARTTSVGSHRSRSYRSPHPAGPRVDDEPDHRRAATAAPTSTIAGPSQPSRVDFALAQTRRPACRRPCSSDRTAWAARAAAAAAAVLGLHEHAPTGREEHGDLAGLGDLDDALTEARVIDALADVELLARAVRANRLRQIRGDRRLLEPLDGRLRARARGASARTVEGMRFSFGAPCGDL